MKTDKRFYHLDALRAIIMSFGVVLHAGMFISVPIDTLVSIFSSTFRMKLFFIISGFFSALVFIKRGDYLYYKDRFFKILIPCVVSVVVICMYSNYLMIEMDGYDKGFSYFINNYFSLISSYDEHINWHLHIWFLFVLTLYCFMFFMLYKAAGFFASIKYVELVNQLPDKFYGLVFCCFLSALCVFFRVIHFFVFQEVLVGGGFNYMVQAFLYYLPFYVAGIYLFIRQDCFLKLHSYYVSVLFLSAIIFSLYLYYRVDLINILSFKLYEVGRHFISSFFGLYFSIFCLSLTYKYLNKKIHNVKFLVDCSYTVYLFHFPVLISLVFAFPSFFSEGYMAYFLLIALTYLFCCLMDYFVVKKVSLFNFAFNGSFSSRKR